MYVVVIGVPIARAIPSAPSSEDTNSPSIAKTKKPDVIPPNESMSSTPTDLKVEFGTDPGTLVVNFPAGSKENAVIASLGPLGLSIIHSDVLTGRYLFSLPKVSVFIERAGDDPKASDKAWLNFPRISTEHDIASYFGKNHLTV